MIKLLHDNLDPDSNFNVAVLACTTVAFWGQCRLSKLLPYSHRSPTTDIPTRSNLHHSHRNKHLHILTLPHTKTSLKGQDIILIPRHDHTDPILLEQHLTVICGLALRQFPRYKSKHHGLTHKDEDKRKWVEYK